MSLLALFPGGLLKMLVEVVCIGLSRTVDPVDRTAARLLTTGFGLSLTASILPPLAELLLIALMIQPIQQDHSDPPMALFGMVLLWFAGPVLQALALLPTVAGLWWLAGPASFRESRRHEPVR